MIEIFYPSEDEQIATGFTPAIVTEILDNLKVGVSLVDGAYLVGLLPKVVNRWYSENKGGFADAVNTAIAMNKRHHIGRVTKAEDSLKVKASSWFLERKYKNEFSKEVTVVVNPAILSHVKHIVRDVLIKFIKDPEILRLSAEEFEERMSEVKMNDLPARITGGDHATG